MDDIVLGVDVLDDESLSDDPKAKRMQRQNRTAEKRCLAITRDLIVRIEHHLLG